MLPEHGIGFRAFSDRLRRALHGRTAALLGIGILFSTLAWRAPGLDFYLTSPDHGYQLALGRQIGFGKFPFVDQFFHYGPLTAFTSGAGLWIFDSLVTETMICALGYACALFLLHRMALFYAGPSSSLLVPLAGLTFLARFYKWYYWLFPLLSLYAFHLYLARSRPRQRFVFLFGAISGIAWLFRFDIGVASLGFFAICITGHCWLESDLKALPARLFPLGLTFLAVVGSWLAALFVVSGTTGLADYARSTWDGSLGAVKGMSTPVPSFDIRRPLSWQSGAAILYAVIPATYLVCLLRGARLCRRIRTGADAAGYCFTAATGLIGLAMFPQALHRAGPLHLIQAASPFFLAVALCTTRPWGRRDAGRFAPHAVLYLSVVAISAWTLRDFAASDLAPWSRNPIPAYVRLHLGLRSDSAHANSRMLRAVQDVVREDEAILVASVITDTQFYYFADRRMSGALVVFAPGVLDDVYWRQRNLNLIRGDPPKAVLVKKGFDQKGSPLSSHQPEILRYVSDNYKSIVFEDGEWLVLAR